MTIRRLSENEKILGVKLAWDVFQIYEAPDFSPEGIMEFKNFLDSKEILFELRFYGAWNKGLLTGIIALHGKHISLFFVADGQHNKGIGRQLFEYAKGRTSYSVMTVNSSPYAVGIYRKMGFTATSPEQLTNGVRYTPMVFFPYLSAAQSLQPHRAVLHS